MDRIGMPFFPTFPLRRVRNLSTLFDGLTEYLALP
jgi:hypothetical protein